MVKQPGDFEAGQTDQDRFTYTWKFGDGGTATGAKVSWLYGVPGRYAVELTVSERKSKRSASCAAVQIVHNPLSARLATHSATVFVDERAHRVWAVNPDANTITAVDTETRKKIVEVRAGLHPRTLAQAPDGAILGGESGQRHANNSRP